MDTPLICRLLEELKTAFDCDPPGRIKFVEVKFDPYTFLGGDIMDITITDNQEFELEVVAVDKKGNPAKLDGEVQWSVSDGALLIPTILSDTRVKITAAGTLGVGQVTAVGDADLGEGMKELPGVLNVTVIAGEATGLTLVPTVPTEQP